MSTDLDVIPHLDDGRRHEVDFDARVQRKEHAKGSDLHATEMQVVCKRKLVADKPNSLINQ